MRPLDIVSPLRHELALLLKDRQSPTYLSVESWAKSVNHSNSKGSCNGCAVCSETSLGSPSGVCPFASLDLVRKKTKKQKTSYARMDAFARGQVAILAKKGYKTADIRDSVSKTDDTAPTMQAVRDCAEKCKANPRWRGEHPARPGRNRVVGAATQKEIVRVGPYLAPQSAPSAP